MGQRPNIACAGWPAAKEQMLEFVSSLHYRPIDAGPLAMARALEGQVTSSGF
jgi:predicted dinucleotide-binding enzyme